MAAGTTTTGRHEPIKAVPVRHPGRWVAVAVIAVLAAMLVHGLASNPNLQWDVFRQFFTSESILTGLQRTIELTVISMAVGIVLGVVLAVMRLSPNPVVGGAAWTYIWFFRGTPVLVQLLIWNYLGALFPTISIGIPFGPQFATWDTKDVITTYMAAILGLGLNEAAYMAEIVRAGLLSVDHGQTEAAQALGMRRLMLMRRIVLPQAMRVIVPPTGNETISMLKTTSLVIVIAYAELLTTAQIIYARNFRTIELLFVASAWYLVITSVLTLIQFYVERYFGRGSARAQPATPMQRLWRNLSRIRPQAARETAAPATSSRPVPGPVPPGMPPEVGGLPEDHR